MSEQPPPATNRPLTEKQRKFCEAFLGPAKGNKTEAARQAGYKGNDNTLCTVARENLEKPHIVAYLDALRAEIQAAIPNALTPEYIHGKWAQLATQAEAEKDLGTLLKILDSAAKANGMYATKLELGDSTKAAIETYQASYRIPDNGRD